ncbi:MAG TPA: hypothetical protein VGU43_07810 [Thermoplasmata archaeon]|nr:hypothetical protein [Thermoplasmata archaeon]
MSDLPLLAEDDQRLVPALEERGVSAFPAVWEDPEVRWNGFDLTVIRSTWDYHRKSARYLKWAARAAEGGRLCNPLEMVRWNSHKSYLAELGQRGLPVLPSEMGRPGERLESILRRRGWSRAVVKPAISADADGAFVVEEGQAAALETRYRTGLDEGPQLIQPYVEEIDSGGEHSHVYFDGTYSHSVRRPPGLSIQGLRTSPATSLEPSPMEREVADRAVAGISPVPLYARVDLVMRRSGPPALMELELIEPSLYLAFHPSAADRLAEAIVRRITARSTGESQLRAPR